MSQKKNLFIKLLSYITYKKKKIPKEFFIPEVNESKYDTNGQEKSIGNDLPPNKNKQESTNDNKGIKKPIPVSQLSKERNQSKAKPDENSLSSDIQSNIDFIMKKFNAPTNKDIVIRQFTIGGEYKAFLSFIDGMADKATINNFILRPLLRDIDLKNMDEECQLDYIVGNVLEINQTNKISDPDDLVYQMLSGNTALYIDGCNYYILCETKGFDKRGVEKPLIEGVVRGPQEAFNENLRTNVTLIRRIIKNNDLTTEFIKVGNRNNILCAVVYINGLINPAIVKEVRRRISSIKTDFISGDGMLEQFIEDTPYSIIPTILNTERPDRTASHIVEGRAAILIEGVPFSLIVPASIHTQIHSPEDFGLRWQYASAIRIIRWLAITIATLLPGLYVAITNYHREMIPTDLLIAIAQAKENVPFPTIVEVLLMEVAFELIREAGIRIPGIIGNTLGIIGALILGQAAVEADIVSPVLIIVIAVTGLGNFAIPNFSLAFGLRLARFGFTLVGALLGFYGIALGFVVTILVVSDMKSFGVPFITPIAPKARKSYDLLFRWPVWKQEFRPDAINALDTRRQPNISRVWTKHDPEDS